MKPERVGPPDVPEAPDSFIPYQDEVLNVALTAIRSCYQIVYFHVWYKMKWNIASHMVLACLGSEQTINLLFYLTFPEHKKKKIPDEQKAQDVEEIMHYMKSSTINAIIGVATIVLRTYIEKVYKTLENQSLFAHFLRSSFAILTVSSIMKYGFGYTTKNILNVMSYHILWGAIFIACLQAANYFFDASLKKYTLAHGKFYFKNLTYKSSRA